MWQCLAAIGPATLASTHFPGGSLFGRNPGQNSPCTHADGCPSVQNSPCTHAGMPEAVQNSPCTHADMPETVQNSPCTHAGIPEPVENSPCTHADMPKAVQNSPSTAKIAHFGPFSACRARIVTLQPETTEAGRLVLHHQRSVPLTEHVFLIETACLCNGKLTLSLTRHSFPPRHVTIGILRKKYRPCSPKNTVFAPISPSRGGFSFTEAITHTSH